MRRNREIEKKMKEKNFYVVFKRGRSKKKWSCKHILTQYALDPRNFCESEKKTCYPPQPTAKKTPKEKKLIRLTHNVVRRAHRA